MVAAISEATVRADVLAIDEYEPGVVPVLVFVQSEGEFVAVAVEIREETVTEDLGSLMERMGPRFV